MGQAGSIVISAGWTRRQLGRAVHLAAKASAARRRMRRLIQAVCAVAAALLVPLAASGDGFDPSTARGASVLGWLACLAIVAVAATDRVWAWSLSRQAWKSLGPTRQIDHHVDDDGVECTQGGVTVRIEWASVTGVAEAPDLMVFVVDKRRRSSFAAIGAQCLDPDERATIRRWVGDAPGERRWLTMGDPDRARELTTSTSGNSAG